MKMSEITDLAIAHVPRGVRGALLGLGAGALLWLTCACEAETAKQVEKKEDPKVEQAEKQLEEAKADAKQLADDIDAMQKAAEKADAKVEEKKAQ